MRARGRAKCAWLTAIALSTSMASARAAPTPRAAPAAAPAPAAPVVFGADVLRGDPGPGVLAVALSPDGGTGAWVCGGEIVVASTHDGRTLHRMRAPAACTDLELDDGGRRVAC